MKIIEEKEIVTFQRYVSEDGQFSRSVKNLSEEEKERVKKDIKDYETSAKGVLFSRLKERNVIRLIEHTNTTEHPDGTPLSESEKTAQVSAWLLDNIMDDGCTRSDYFMFMPKTEEDIQDMFKYLKLEYQYMSVPDGSETPGQYRNTLKIETGKAYILMLNTECEYYSFILPELLKERVVKMCDYYTKLGKEWLKNK